MLKIVVESMLTVSPRYVLMFWVPVSDFRLDISTAQYYEPEEQNKGCLRQKGFGFCSLSSKAISSFITKEDYIKDRENVTLSSNQQNIPPI
ncbi:unnamed protein product [Hermetia illucens]|uniref:Uncharacterized protein n=1 Tax=Hermetia illucens TaxID=343691 RepID=A0A7R8UX89_HERIL|nr:unnamed protein product [Hermetia illucens]